MMRIEAETVRRKNRNTNSRVYIPGATQALSYKHSRKGRLNEMLGLEKNISLRKLKEKI